MTVQFYAGVARSNITPPVGIAHGNWSAQIHERAEGVDLPLYCSVIAAAGGDEVWVSPYAPDTANIVTKTSLDLLRLLAD